MNSEMMETVLQDLLEERSESKKLIQQLMVKMDHLSGLIEYATAHQNHRQPNVSPTSTDALLEVKSDLNPHCVIWGFNC